ncbi:HlyD family secretion protein [Bacteroidales bacterium OttesenSCG-928-M06]|nr:HlyD family secretion protein [Bacteroidales bacterium OttesenSCG-928-M06]
MNEEDKIELRSEEFQEVLGSVPPWILRWGITVLAIFVVLLLVGSSIIKYPDVVPATLTLTSSIPPAGVVTGSSGKIKEMYVSDNQTISKGDYLAVIDNPAQTEDILFLKKYLENFDPEDIATKLPKENLLVGNIQSTWESFYITLFDYLEYKRLAYFPQKVMMTEERIRQYEKLYESQIRQDELLKEQFLLTQRQLERDSSLNKKGGLSQKELENSKQQYLQGLLSLESSQSSVRNMELQIKQLKESLFDTHYQDIEKLNTLRSQIKALTLQLKTEIRNWELNNVLRGPIDGKITFTKYWSVNQNVSAGEEIFTIIPLSGFDIIGKAALPTTRSGKVKVGQKVNIQLDNFPENEYGIIQGEVANISLVPSNDGTSNYNYTVEIRLPQNLETTYKKKLPYMPNMQGYADIITEDISLLERFFMPIKKVINKKI